MRDGKSTTEFALPTSLRGWISVGEVSDGRFFIDGLFQRKYGCDAPDYGRHIVGFYRGEDGALLPLSYLHFWEQDRIGLIGGGCTDGQVMRQIPKSRAQVINTEGGMLRQTLLYAFTQFCGGIDAFFGHAGDARAREVDLAAGFYETEFEYLLIRPVGTLSPDRRQQLMEQALALGSF